MKGMTPATLLRRYKRFLADCILESGERITAHCPNTGSMKNCVEEGARIWLSKSDNPKRKYAFTWEYLITAKGHTIGVNTGNANHLVADAIDANMIPELTGYDQLFREQKYGSENSRIDILLTDSSKQDCFIEVKSVTLLEAPASRGLGYFPDAVSERGAKHLRELGQVAASGRRAVLFYCVQHTGIQEVRPADHIDQRYGETLRRAIDQGVEVIAYKVRRTPGGFKLWRAIPVNV